MSVDNATLLAAIVAVNVALPKLVKVALPLKSPASVIVGSAVAVVAILIPALPSKFAVPVTAPVSAIALAVVSVAALPVVFWFSVATRAAATVPELILLPFNEVKFAPLPLNAAAVNVPVLGLYVNPLSCVAAVNAPDVTDPTYTNLSAFVASSFVTTAPAAPKDKFPLASVISACPLVPSAPGSLNVTFDATVSGACNATKFEASASLNLTSPLGPVIISSTCSSA